MEFNFAPTGRIKESEFILSNANHKRLCYMNGVTKADLSGVFIDISEIRMEVQKYIWNPDTQELVLSNGYNDIDVLMEVEVPSIGWFRIDESPSVEATSSKSETKSFTLRSYETQLSDTDLKSFVVNKGSSESIEMYDENLNSLGIPNETVSLYNEENKKLSLLDQVLDETVNWSVGHVDETIKGLKRSFEIDSQDVLSFLMNDCAQSYRCIFTFDTTNFKVNAYDLETFGYDTGIFFNYRNLINTLNIEPYTNEIYTRFEVAGEDDLNIAGYNFGSNYITNIDYFIDRFPKSTQDKYRIYKDTIDSIRPQFIEKYKEWVRENEKKTELEDRLPQDDTDNTWALYDDEELQTTLDAYKNMVETLRQMYTDENGIFNIDGYPDYSLYYTYKDVVIPDIESEIARRAASEEEYTPVDYKKMYNLYGSIGLQTLKTTTENTISALAESGYDKDYTEAMAVSKATYDIHHQEWIDAKAELVKIDAEISKRDSEISAIEQNMTDISSVYSSIAKKAQIEHVDYGFTTDEIVAIKLHYRSTDFKDENMVLSEYDDAISQLDVQKDLYDSAVEELDIESHPQLDFSVDSENIFAMQEFEPLRAFVQLGSFMHVEVNDFLIMKLRLSEIDLDLLDISSDFSIKFTSQTLSKGKYNDYNNLVASAISSAKNTITKDANNYVSSNITALSGAVTASIIKPYLEVMNANIQNAVVGAMTAEDLSAVIGRFNTIITDYIKTDELDAAIANIGSLNADSAFVKYLESEFAKFTNVDVEALTTKLAQIDDLIAGTVSAELGHIIKLTANNVTIEDAVIKDLIAGKMSVSDLMAGNISTNKFNIVSADGGMSIVGNTMQFKDAIGNVGIQLGYDETGKPNLVICDSNGNIMLDGSGLHDAIVPDGFVKNEMVGDGEISKGKLDFNVMDANDDGTIDAGKVVINGQGMDIEFTTIKNSVETLDKKIDGISVGGRNLLLESDVAITNNNYNIHIYTMSENMKDGEQYTCRIWGSLGSENQYFGMWLDGDSIGLGSLENNGDETYSLTFTGKSGNLTPSKLYIYTVPSATNVNSTITKIKLEQGNKATDWTPAPEDVQERFTSLTETVSGVSTKANSAEKSITDKVWRTDTVTVKDKNGNTVEKSIEDILVMTTTDISGVNTTVSAIDTYVAGQNKTVTQWMTQATQTATEMSWLVKSGTASTNFVLTDRVASLLSNEFQITALTTFMSNAKNGGQTVIDGGAITSDTFNGNKIIAGTITANEIATDAITAIKIQAGAITTDKLDASAVTADKIFAGAVTADKILTGAVTADKVATDAIYSKTWAYTAGNTFMDSGMQIDLSGNGFIRSKNFAITADGDAYFRGVVNATSGNIGMFTISDYLNYDSSDVVSDEKALMQSHTVTNMISRDPNGSGEPVQITAEVISQWRSVYGFYTRNVTNGTESYFKSDEIFMEQFNNSIPFRDTTVINPSEILLKKGTSSGISQLTITPNSIIKYQPSNTTVPSIDVFDCVVISGNPLNPLTGDSKSVAYLFPSGLAICVYTATNVSVTTATANGTSYYYITEMGKQNLPITLKTVLYKTVDYTSNYGQVVPYSNRDSTTKYLGFYVWNIANRNMAVTMNYKNIAVGTWK